MSTKAKAINNASEASWEAIIPGVSQQIAVTPTSTQGTAFQAGTKVIRTFSTVDCFVQIGSSPVADTTTSMFIPGGLESYFGVDPGNVLAVIAKSSSGTFYITEGA